MEKYLLDLRDLLTTLDVADSCLSAIAKIKSTIKCKLDVVGQHSIAPKNKLDSSAGSESIDELKAFIKTMSNKNPYEMFSIDEAAIAFNISKLRITKAVNSNELQEFKLDGKQRSLRRGDIEKWIDSKLKVNISLFREKYFTPATAPIPLIKSEQNYEIVKKTILRTRAAKKCR